MVSIWIDLESLVCAPAPDGMMECAEGQEAVGLRTVMGGLGRSSLSVNIFSLSRANQWSKPLMASGLSTCPYFFQLVCVYVYVSVSCCMWEHLTLSWRVDVNKRTNQKTNKQQKGAQTKAPPAARKYQTTPTPLLPTTSVGSLSGSTMPWLLASTNTQLPGRENSWLHREQGKAPTLALQELQLQCFTSSFCKS